jgi:hypothetical protein
MTYMSRKLRFVATYDTAGITSQVRMLLYRLIMPGKEHLLQWGETVESE